MDDYSILNAELPTMVVRYNNNLVLRSVITGQHLQVIGPAPSSGDENIPAAVRQRSLQIEQEYIKALEAVISLIPYENLTKTSTTKPVPVATEIDLQSPANQAELPPCKVQRNYCCTLCAYYTQNPRSHLLHQRDVHGIRLSIHGCQHCQYASRYCQKLKRHIKMVHTLGNAQEAMVKNEKLEKDSNKNLKATAVKTNETSNITQENSKPLVEQPFKPSVEQSYNKTVTNPAHPVDVKSDPEAFFVSAYKNQLQKQLEYEQHLKEFAKSFSTESNKPEKPFELPKQFSKPSTIPTIQLPPKSDKPEPINEESNEIKAEVNKKRLYSCRKCNYITHIKSRYNKHVKYHSMPMIQCDKCEFRTTYKWNLTRHLRSHHSNGIYKCSVCSFSANMKQSLTSHEVNHHSPPVGRAIGNKPIRKRRCRVGGSDLLCEDDNTIEQTNFSKEETEKQSNVQSNDTNEIIKNETLHSNSIGFSANVSLKSEVNNHDPTTMDFSDSDKSEFETSGSSDIEAESCEDTSSSESEKFNHTHVHVDADFLNTSAGDGQNYVNPIDEQRFLHSTANNFTASTSASISSISTISADETSDRNSRVSCNTRYWSSSEIEEDDDDVEFSSSGSITSDISFM